ncbi:cytochrome b6 [Neisseria animalis]|uniref:Cytochrome b6 n=1 Tax=Neisseria animalis TaxID=492 RepID=A0A5P3MNS8_NEIAN|nr:cytochrome b6 [Neisseria animalis]QEY23197.1 cytochrome b6 [Neisseria animalis]ROW31771.1 cytochrome b6 [Neisseria animalis]VEE08361.1 Uncharacterised protein [Neisseria animalis]
MALQAKVKANTYYAFACIGLMLSAFLVFAAVSIIPFGITAAQQLAVIRISLYALVLFAVLGGAFSLRVAILRKQFEKSS